MIIRFVYIVFLGVLLATFVGVGIAAFYPGPNNPEPPKSLSYPYPPEKTADATLSAVIQADQEKFNQVQKEFETHMQLYNRNISIISLIASIIILVVSLTWFRKILLIADGLLLGGVLDLCYSIIRGFSAHDNQFRFVVVSAGLIISLMLGYIKFIKPAHLK